MSTPTIKSQTVRLDSKHTGMVVQLQAMRSEGSFQQLVEKLLEEEVARQQKNWGSLAAGFVKKNQRLFDKLADL
jgi:hypothetical protein